MEQSDSEVPLGKPRGRGRVGIIYNLKKDGTYASVDAQAEYDNIETVYGIRDALGKAGYETVLLEADASLVDNLKTEKIDIAFNIAEGVGGRSREGQVPAILEMLGIPRTGSDAAALCVALDKALAKRLVSTYKVRTPKYAVFKEGSPIKLGGMRFPVIVKPDAEGSGKGISEVSVAKDKKELTALLRQNFAVYGGDMLVEEYIEGREFTVGMLGNGKDRVIFPPMEIIYKKPTQDNYHVYSYCVKQDYTKYVEYKCPADIEKATENELIEFTAKICDALGCDDFARADFRVSPDGKAWFIEVNPLPGLAPGYSDFPMIASFCGLGYDELVVKVLAAALKRYGLAEV